MALAARISLNRTLPARALKTALVLFIATGCGSSLSIATASAETAPGSTACNLYAASSGSDGASGSSTAPLKTIKALIARLQAGQVGCLASGQTFNESFTVRAGESHGATEAPVTLTSTDPEDPALINGRVVTETGADWLTFTHLDFTYSEYGLPSVTIGSKHTTWTYDDITAPTTICMNLVNSSYGVAEDTLVEHSRIHGCGSKERFICNENTTYCSTPPNDGFFIHGIYVAGAKETTIRNNYIYENADRGIQVRSGSNGVTVERNLLDRNGEGVILGEGATHVTIQWNLITNSHSPCGELAGCYDYGVSEYQAVAPNVVAHNDVYGNQCASSAQPSCYPNKGNIETMSHVTSERNLEADPLYTSAAAHNYTLQSGSPSLGYGPDTAQPTSGGTTPVEKPVETAPETPEKKTEPVEKAPESTPPGGTTTSPETPAPESGGSTTPPIVVEHKGGTKSPGGGGSTPPITRRRVHRHYQSRRRVLHRSVHPSRLVAKHKHG